MVVQGGKGKQERRMERKRRRNANFSQQIVCWVIIEADKIEREDVRLVGDIVILVERLLT
jgi:hypothetical protein